MCCADPGKVEDPSGQCGGIRRVYGIYPYTEPSDPGIDAGVRGDHCHCDLGEEEDPYQMDGEQKLFHLSKKQWRIW